MHDPSKGAAAERRLRLLKVAPELAKEIEARSSRDRIARGAALNAWLVLPVWGSDIAMLRTIACAAAAALLTYLWIFHEQRSYLFELCALKVFENREARKT